LIQDLTGNYFTFLKYKGAFFDFEEHIVKNSENDPVKKAEFIEGGRKRMMYSMKAGTVISFYFGKFKGNLKDFFSGTNWFE